MAGGKRERDSDTRNTLLDALARVGFEDNELAYLALTGKLERQIVDRIAWRLYGQELIPAREWRRRDLVLLEGSRAIAVMEAKAFYSFDVMALRSFDKYKKFILDDIEKARGVPGSPEIFMLTLVTNVLDPVPIELRNIVKYDYALRTATDHQAARAAIDEFLSTLGPTDQKRMVGGRAFDVSVEVDVWLCGPIRD